MLINCSTNCLLHRFVGDICYVSFHIDVLWYVTILMLVSSSSHWNMVNIHIMTCLSRNKLLFRVRCISDMEIKISLFPLFGLHYCVRSNKQFYRIFWNACSTISPLYNWNRVWDYLIFLRAFRIACTVQRSAMCTTIPRLGIQNRHIF